MPTAYTNTEQLSTLHCIRYDSNFSIKQVKLFISQLISDTFIICNVILAEENSKGGQEAVVQYAILSCMTTKLYISGKRYGQIFTGSYGVHETDKVKCFGAFNLPLCLWVIRIPMSDLYGKGTAHIASPVSTKDTCSEDTN